MKIGIFGDSYGVNLPKDINPTLSWVDIVQNHYDCKNFSRTGSSLYYSFEEFTKNHHQFDKIIFIVTSPYRLYVKEFNIHIPSINHVEYHLNNENSRVNKKIYQLIHDYYKYLHNIKQDLLIHELILDRLVNGTSNIRFKELIVDPDIHENFNRKGDILFLNTATPWLLFNGDPVYRLMQANLIDYNFYFPNANNVNFEYHDQRHCHMNELNNEILGNEVLKYIETGKFNFNETIWKTDSPDKRDLYFKKVE